MNIAVCDDNKITLNTLNEIISQELKRNSLYYENISLFDSGRTLLDKYYKTHFDVIFLDIRMPGLSGFDVAAKLRDISNRTFIIFITTESELVFNAFDFQPFHFIRKNPPEYLEMQLKNVIKKLSRHIKQNDTIVLELAYSEKKRVRVRDIIYISSEKNYLIYHFMNSQIKLRGSITDASDKYLEYDFIRVHNRLLVNMKNISMIDFPNDEIKLKGGEVISIGRVYKKKLNEQYTLYLRSLR